MTEDLIHQLGYLGIVLVLVLGGLGLPMPEEAPIILAAVLSKKESLWWPLALGACFAGVLLGDFVVYFLGFFYGERVLRFRLTRKFLTRAREAQIKGYFHRHGFKILILGRFAVGFRTAAYLTAGILRLPPLRLFLTDLVAASMSTLLMFYLGWRFAGFIEAGMQEAKPWIFVAVIAAVMGWLLWRYYHALRRAGQPVGPPVLVSEEIVTVRKEPRPAAQPAQAMGEPPPVEVEPSTDLAPPAPPAIDAPPEAVEITDTKSSSTDSKPSTNGPAPGHQQNASSEQASKL